MYLERFNNIFKILLNFNSILDQIMESQKRNINSKVVSEKSLEDFMIKALQESKIIDHVVIGDILDDLNTTTINVAN